MTRNVFFICLFGLTAFANAVTAYELPSLGIAIHGFVSQGYLKSDDNNFLTAETEDGSFQFNEMGINFNKQLTDSLHLGIQLLSRDQGVVGNNEVKIDWAYGDYRWRDWLGLRVGVMRIPLGLYNETRDLDFLRTSILLPQSVYNENLRDYFSRIRGVGLYGQIPLNAAGALGYNLMVGTADIDPDGGVARSVETSGRMAYIDGDVGTIYNGSLQWQTPLEGLSIQFTHNYKTDTETEVELLAPAGSDMPPGAQMPPDVGQDSGMPEGPDMPDGTSMPSGMVFVDHLDKFEIHVLSAEYSWNDLVVAAEYMKMTRRSKIQGIPITLEQDSLGYYLSASYRFTDWFELGSYYSIYYQDEDDKDGDELEARGEPDYRAWLKDWAVTTRFDINPNCNFKLEGHMMDGAALVMPQDNPDGFDEHWFMLAAKVSFYF